MVRVCNHKGCHQLQNLHFTVPSAAPLELMVQNSSANSLSVSWQRPEQEDLNGILIRYDIEYFIAEEPNPQILSESVDTLTTMLMALNNYTIYNVSVYAVTIGRGPPANQQERTSENGGLTLSVFAFVFQRTFTHSAWRATSECGLLQHFLHQCSCGVDPTTSRPNLWHLTKV